MKNRIYLFLAALLGGCMTPARAQNLDTLPSLNGADVNRAVDKVLVRDASVSAAAGALRWVDFDELVNIPGMYSTLEPALGNPGTNGYLLSSTTGGTRSWVPPPTSATWGSITGTLASQTDINSALGGKQATLVSATNLKTVNGATLLGSGDLTVAGGLDGTAAALRTGNILGHDSLVRGQSSKLWPLVSRMLRRNAQSPSFAITGRLRGVFYGDSVTVAPMAECHTQLGYGGKNFQVQNGGNAANAATGVGVCDSSLYSKSLFGYVRTLTNPAVYPFTASGQVTAVTIAYNAKVGGGGFTLRYQPNKTGGFTTATSAWAIGGFSRPVYGVLSSATVYVPMSQLLEVGMPISGSGVPGGTTVTAITPSASVAKTCNITSTPGAASIISVPNTTGLALNMTVTGAGIPAGAYISAISVAGNTVTMNKESTVTNASAALTFAGKTVTLSAALTSATPEPVKELSFSMLNSGTDAGAGVLNTGGGSVLSGDGRVAFATMNLPAMDLYNFEIVPTSGSTVEILDIWMDGGGLGGGVSGQNNGNGFFGIDCTNGGKRIAAHFSQTTEDIWRRFFAVSDPDFFVYKSINDVSLSYLQTNWPGFIAKVKAAGPDIPIIVVGTSPTGAAPTREDAAQCATDDYWREWCAANDAIFVDVRSSYPASNIAGDMNDLWGIGDDLHPYQGGSEWERWLVMDTLQPAFRWFGSNSPARSQNPFRTLPGNVNEVKLLGDYDPANLGAYGNSFYFTAAPRQAASVLLRSSDSAYNAGLGGVSNKFAGFTMAASAEANNLYLHSNGGNVATFKKSKGMHFSSGQFSSYAKADNGVMISGVDPSQGQFFSNLTVEAIEETQGSLLDLRIGSPKGSSPVRSQNQPLFTTWVNGVQEYWGVTDDNHRITYRTEEPTAAACGGSGYSSAPTVVIGTEWIASDTYTLYQYVAFGGNHYYVSTAGTSGTVAPTHTSGTVAATGGTASLTYAGVRATATAILTGDKITSVTVNTGGSGYPRTGNLGAARVTFTGGGGTGASASIVSSGNISAITLNANVTTPINAIAGTGKLERVIGVIPSYVSIAAGETALPVGRVFYAEDIKEVCTAILP